MELPATIAAIVAQHDVCLPGSSKGFLLAAIARLADANAEPGSHTLCLAEIMPRQPGILPHDNFASARA